VLARIAKLYEIEAEVRGQPADVRRAIRQERSRPLVEDLQSWLQDHVSRLPGWSDLAKAMRYALAHWDGLILYLDDGRLEMDTNVVERAIRPVTITRKNSMFAGSDAGARRWAIANTLIQTCKLNGIDPLAYLTDVLQRIISGRTKNHELHTMLPWNWHPPSTLADDLHRPLRHRLKLDLTVRLKVAASTPSCPQCKAAVTGRIRFAAFLGRSPDTGRLRNSPVSGAPARQRGTTAHGQRLGLGAALPLHRNARPAEPVTPPGSRTTDPNQIFDPEPTTTFPMIVAPGAIQHDGSMSGRNRSSW